MSVQARIQQLIEKHAVVVFAKTYCPYCNKVKSLFDSMHAKFEAVELDKDAQGADIQAALLEMTGQRTVPNVFINGAHIGGCDDTHAAAKDGTLEKLLGHKVLV